MYSNFMNKTQNSNKKKSISKTKIDLHTLTQIPRALKMITFLGRFFIWTIINYKCTLFKLLMVKYIFMLKPVLWTTSTTTKNSLKTILYHLWNFAYRHVYILHIDVMAVFIYEKQCCCCFFCVNLIKIYKLSYFAQVPYFHISWQWAKYIVLSPLWFYM